MHLDGSRGSGFFLTLEGPEGSGKSTQGQRLASRLTAAGYRCVLTREPGGTLLGEGVREILLHLHSPVPAADALLFNAARAQLVAEVIQPALVRGEVVICDRFGDSTLAYQGYGEGRPLDGLRRLAEFAVGDLVPDLTILIDLPAEEGLRRKQGGNEINRFELHHDPAFHERVRDGFLSIAAAEPRRFVVLDGLQSAESIERSILEIALVRLDAKGLLRARNLNGSTDERISSFSEPDGASVRRDK
jgi:dTMP kinase